MAWKTLQLRDVEAFVEPIDTAANLLVSGIDTLNSILSVTVSVLDVVSALLIDKISLEAIAIKAVTVAINEILDSLTGTASAHFLNIPLHKGTNTSLSNLIADTINDPDDVYKPMYGQGNAIAGVLLVYGTTAEGIIDLLEGLINLQNLFGGFSHGVDNFNLPIPKSLTAKLVTTPLVDENSITLWPQITEGGNIRTFGRVRGVRSGPSSVVLAWEPRPVDIFISSLGIGVRLTGIHIFKHTADFSSDVESGVVDPTTLDQYKIDTYDYNAYRDNLARYIDDDIDIETDKVLYYSVGYSVEIDNDSSTIPINKYLVAKPIAINVGQYAENGRLPRNYAAAPPNWQAVVNPLQIIPGFVDIINKIRDLVIKLEGTNTGIATQLKNFIAFLQKVVDINAKEAQELLAKLSIIIRILQSINIGVSVYGFSDATGGNSAILSSVSSALTDKTQTGRPGFDAPTPSSEGSNSPFILGAMMMVAGGSGLGDIAPAVTLFNLLSGADSANSLFNTIGQEFTNLNNTIRNTILELRDETLWTADIAGLITSSDVPVTETQEDLNNPLDPYVGTEDDITTKIC